ncbi:MAG: hypothetical protein MUC58_00870 [Rhizobiaceae bacterium]|nr:hypothetical protein [Rhizobiaceae bacterium]
MSAEAAQPDIEGVPAEFAHEEAAGLARTLGLKRSAPPVAVAPAETEVGVEVAAHAAEAAPRRARTRRPRRDEAEAAAEPQADAGSDLPAEVAPAAE